jgi:arylsulfatase A-like enzyme
LGQFGYISRTDYFTHERDGTVDWHRDDQASKDEGYSTHLLAKEASRLIREHSSDKPLFLYLPFNAVHAPHEVPEKYQAPYQQLPGTRRIYAGMVAAMDEAIGQVVAALEEKGLKENTLIIFSSDNGGPSPGKITNNGPFRAGKGTLYEGGVRVCAFANWPGHIPAGQTIREPIHIVDWYPTLLKVAAAATEQDLAVDGRDIGPVLTAKGNAPHDAILLCGTRGPTPAAIRMGDWKLLVGASEVDAEAAPVSSSAAGEKVELYNLADDPGETQNLAASQGEKVKELRARLNTWLAAAVPSGERAAQSGAAPGGRTRKIKRNSAP